MCYGTGLRLAAKGAVLSYGEGDDPHEWSRVVTYQITLECEGESYLVEKRYSQLVSIYQALRSLSSRRVEIPRLPRLSRLLVRTNSSIDRIERRRVEIDSWLRRLTELPKKEQCILVHLLGRGTETECDDSKVKSVWQGPTCPHHGSTSLRWDHLTIRLPWAGETFGCGRSKVVKMFHSRHEDIDKTAGAHSEFVQFCKLVQRHERVPTGKEARAFWRYARSVGRSASDIVVPTLGDFCGVDLRSSISSYSQCLDDDDVDIQVTPPSPRRNIPCGHKAPDHDFLLPPPNPWDA